MEQKGYPAVNSKNLKTTFMKRMVNNFIVHSMFVGGIMHVPVRVALKQEFLEMYTKSFNITCCGLRLVKTFLGMQVEQSDEKNHKICFCLDKYIDQEEFQEFAHQHE
jgi:hypothetical protein